MQPLVQWGNALYLGLNSCEHAAMHCCLVIEQSPIVRRVISAILTDFGYRVHDCATGREGIALFDRLKPGTIIVDAALTDMAALDVLRHVRRAGGERHVMYCTTVFDLLDLQRAHAAGANDVLIKPFDRASIAARLDAWSEAPRSEASLYARL